jgi:hypothetical protein
MSEIRLALSEDHFLFDCEQPEEIRKLLWLFAASSSNHDAPAPEGSLGK